MKEEMIRSFIAIAIDKEVLEKIGDFQRELMRQMKRTDCQVSWVKPETIHLTLKFLGDISISQISHILDSMRSAMEGIENFAMEIEGLGVFPNFKAPRVIWIGISEGKEYLQTLQPRLEKELAKVGFIPEKNKFKPHLTLGRIRSYQKSVALDHILASITSPVAGLSKVKEIKLMKSELHPSGAIHTELGRVSLIE